jgi:hypothetical protein
MLSVPKAGESLLCSDVLQVAGNTAPGVTALLLTSNRALVNECSSSLAANGGWLTNGIWILKSHSSIQISWSGGHQVSGALLGARYFAILENAINDNRLIPSKAMVTAVSGTCAMLTASSPKSDVFISINSTRVVADEAVNV